MTTSRRTPPPYAEAGDRGYAIRGLIPPIVGIALITYAYLNLEEKPTFTFWTLVPLATLALAARILQVVRPRPAIAMDARGIAMMPPGARLAWERVRTITVRTARPHIWLPKRTELGVVPMRLRDLRWDPPWSPARLFSTWEVIRRRPAMSLILEGGVEEAADMVALIRRYADRPIALDAS